MRVALLFGHELCKKRKQLDDENDDDEAERSDGIFFPALEPNHFHPGRVSILPPSHSVTRWQHPDLHS